METGSISALFVASENKRRKLDQYPSATSPEYQELLEATINDYAQCLDTADRVSLFSPNETLDDVSTNDIQ